MRAEAKEEGGATRKGEGSNETGREDVESIDIEMSSGRVRVGAGVGSEEGFTREVLDLDFDRSIFCWSFDKGFFVPSSVIVVVGVLDAEEEVEGVVVNDFESVIFDESFEGFTESFEGFGVGVGVVGCKDSPSIFFVVSFSRFIALD